MFPTMSETVAQFVFYLSVAGIVVSLGWMIYPALYSVVPRKKRPHDIVPAGLRVYAAVIGPDTDIEVALGLLNQSERIHKITKVSFDIEVDGKRPEGKKTTGFSSPLMRKTAQWVMSVPVRVYRNSGRVKVRVSVGFSYGGTENSKLEYEVEIEQGGTVSLDSATDQRALLKAFDAKAARLRYKPISISG